MVWKFLRYLNTEVRDLVWENFVDQVREQQAEIVGANRKELRVVV